MTVNDTGKRDWKEVVVAYSTVLSQHFQVEGSMDHWNVGILPQHHTASEPRRPRLESSPPWKPQNSYHSIFLV